MTQPFKVCIFCGHLYAKQIPGAVVWYYAECDVCHAHKAVTSAKNFGQFDPAWEAHNPVERQ